MEAQGCHPQYLLAFAVDVEFDSGKRAIAAEAPGVFGNPAPELTKLGIADPYAVVELVMLENV